MDHTQRGSAFSVNLATDLLHAVKGTKKHLDALGDIQALIATRDAGLLAILGINTRTR